MLPNKTRRRVRYGYPAATVFDIQLIVSDTGKGLSEQELEGRLPGIAEMAALSELKADPRTSQIPVIANALPEDIRRAEPACFIACLV